MDSVIKFYKLDLMGQEMWRDLLLNALTNMVLHKNIYIMYYNLTHQSLEQELKIVIKNSIQLQHIAPSQLGIPDLLGECPKESRSLFNRFG